jgi:O-antigen ligase
VDDQALPTRRLTPSLGGAGPAARGWSRATVPAAVCGAAAAAAAWMVAHGATRMVVAGCGAVVLGVALLRSPRLGLLVGAAMVLTLPYSYELGSPLLTGYRVAALLALAVVLDATRTRWCAIDIAFAALVAYVFARWWFSPPMPGSGRILVGEMTPAAFYLAARLWWRGRARTLQWVLLVGAAVGALTVLREAIQGSAIYSDPGSYSWNEEPGSIFRAGGIFASPPGAAAVLSMAALASLPLVRASRGRAKVAAIACLTLCAVAIFFTYTRAGLIGFVAGGILYLVLSRSPLLSLGRVIVGALLLILAFMVALPALDRSTTFQEGFLRKGNLAARESYWALAVPITTRDAGSFAFGIGVNATLSGRFGGPVQAAVAEAPVLTVNGTHNQYVLALLEQGAVGAGLFVAWLLLSLGTGLRLRGDPDAAAFTAGVLAFGIMASINNLLLHTPSLSLLALCVGVLAAMSARPRRAGRDPR